MAICISVVNRTSCKARAPDLLPMVSDLVSLPLPDSLSVKDVMDDMVCKITGGEDLFEPNRYHESLELGFERVRNAAIRLQAVLQQHVNFRIPKKKAKGIPERSGDQLSKDNGRKNLRTDNSSSVSLCENSDQVGCASPVPNCMDAKTVQTKPRVRVSRWSSDYRPKRRKSASKERCDIEVIRCRIDPPMTAIRPSNTTIELTSAKRSRTIEDEPVIVTTVIPPSVGVRTNASPWPQPTNIPPPPPPQLLSPSQIMVPPPPPTVPPAVIPFYDYGSYGGPPIPTLPNYQTYEYSLANEERRLQILTEEMLILQSIRDQKMKKVEVESPLPQSTLQPSTTKTPPPPPPPHKEYMWKKAVDEDGAKYYYHKETRESVWELPDGEDSDPAERTPTRMPDTSGCGNDPEPDNMKHDEGSILSRWSAMCSPQVSTSSTTQTIHSSTTTIASESVNRALHANERKRDRDRRIWEKFETDTDRKRAKKLMSDIETVVGPIIVHHIGHRNDATKKKREWIIKQVSKEMLKRESERSDFNFILTEKGSKRVTDYANAFIQRKCAKEPKDLWKGYDGSP
ncbi:WW domain protein [Dictyocaulus viviparus]|uniref:WW domain protein n=1 Tax=Dictyocaulus viviparus TaxID=29172 RepID=A0A0D8Y8B3_DICVI|nr:WW domain protein [Dictyocaulus viviparus]